MDVIARERMWKWCVGLNAVTAIVFIAHLVEDQMRGFLNPLLWTVVAPLVVALVVGTAYAATRHLTGLGMALAVDLWLVVVMGTTHINPASPESMGAINGYWGGGAAGAFAAGLALALWLVALVALVQGLWAITRLEERPVLRRAGAARPS